MKYLDAKKKLIFMMATAKYIRLYMDQNNLISITDEDVKTVTVQALRMYSKDSTVTVKDCSEIIGGVKSLILKAGIQVKTTSELALTAGRWDTIGYDEYVKIFNALQITFTGVSPVKIDNFLKAYSDFSLAVSKLIGIYTDAIVGTKGLSTIVAEKDTNISFNKKILTPGKMNVDFTRAFEVSLEETIRTLSSLEPTLDKSTVFKFLSAANIKAETLVTPGTIQNISMDSLIKLRNDVKIELYKIVGSNINTDSKIKINSKFDLPLLHSALIGTRDKKLTITSNLSIDAFKFTPLAFTDIIGLKSNVVINNDESNVIGFTDQLVTPGNMSFDFLKSYEVVINELIQSPGLMNSVTVKSEGLSPVSITYIKPEAFVDADAIDVIAADTVLKHKNEVIVELYEIIGASIGAEGLVKLQSQLQLPEVKSKLIASGKKATTISASAEIGYLVMAVVSTSTVVTTRANVVVSPDEGRYIANKKPLKTFGEWMFEPDQIAWVRTLEKVMAKSNVDLATVTIEGLQGSGMSKLSHEVVIEISHFLALAIGIVPGNIYVTEEVVMNDIRSVNPKFSAKLYVLNDTLVSDDPIAAIGSNETAELGHVVPFIRTRYGLVRDCDVLKFDDLESQTLESIIYVNQD